MRRPGSQWARQARPLAALRHATQRHHPAYLDRPAAMAEHVAALADALRTPGRRLRILGDPARPRAFVLQAACPENWTGRPLLQASAEADPRDPDAVTWMARTAAMLSLARDPAYLLSLDIAHAASVPRLASVGLGVDSVTLVGQTAPALARLMGHRPPPDSLHHLGLQVDRLRPQDVDAALRLKQRVFAAAPQWAWFAAWPEHLAQTRGHWLDGCRDPHALLFVVRQGPRILGVFEASPQGDTGAWGPSAGIDLCLAPEVQGQGAIWTLYRILLTALARRGVRVFRGGTAQPGVLVAAERLGRHPTTLHVRPAPRLPIEHFMGFKMSGLGRAHARPVPG